LGYDDSGQPTATTFMDYRMPTAAEIPRIDLLVCEHAPAPGNPLGVRGAGEGGITAAGAVLASAVRDALGGRQDVTALPLTPARGGPLAERPGAARADRRPGGGGAVDHAAAEPDGVVHDRRGHPARRRAGHRP